jgi:hypothetical protein
MGALRLLGAAMAGIVEAPGYACQHLSELPRQQVVRAAEHPLDRALVL